MSRELARFGYALPEPNGLLGRSRRATLTGPATDGTPTDIPLKQTPPLQARRLAFVSILPGYREAFRLSNTCTIARMSAPPYELPVSVLEWIRGVCAEVNHRAAATLSRIVGESAISSRPSERAAHDNWHKPRWA